MGTVERPIMTRPGHRLSGRDTESLLSSLSRYTKFVFLSKISLGVISFLMIFTIVILPVINADEEGLRIAFSTVKDKTESLPSMTNPTFQGVDEKNQPYLVTADSALQHDERTIILINVQADMVMDSNTWLSVKAQKGTIDTEAKRMQLNSDVKLFHQQGYEFRTEVVNIDMNIHQAWGNQGIRGFGPMGDIESDSFKWDHNAKVMTFAGNVKMKVEPNG